MSPIPKCHLSDFNEQSIVKNSLNNLMRVQHKIDYRLYQCP